METPDHAVQISKFSNESHSIGPNLTLSDYIEVIYNFVAMVIGIPINFWALNTHIRSLRTRPPHARLVWLGVHLTLANLMILLIHSAGSIVWILTYFWYGGDLVCRVFKCVSIMSFHLSSNVVVSIALDMFYSLRAPLRSQINDGRKRVRVFLSISWTLAVLFSLPQLYLWGEIDDFAFETKKLCFFLYFEHVNFTRTYNLAHLLCVFYIPLMFILFCYLGSGYHVWRHLRLQSDLIQYDVDIRKKSDSSGKLSVSNVDPSRRQSTISMLQSRRRSSNSDRQTRTKIRLLRKSALVIGAYIFCWLPYQIFSVWQSFCDADCESQNFEIITTKLRWLEALMISCACINPFLYTFVNYRQNPVQTASDSSRRESNEGQTFANVKRRSLFLNTVSKRGSLFINTNACLQHPQVTALRRTSLAIIPRRNHQERV